MAAHDDEPRRRAARRPAGRAARRSPATVTPSAGGRTSSSPAAKAAARSRPSPRRWALREAFPEHDAVRGSAARRTCASRSAAPNKQGSTTSRSSAAPGTRPRSPSSAPPRLTRESLKGLPEGQGRDDLGAVDVRAFARVSATAPASTPPGLVRPALSTRPTTRSPRWLSRAAQLLRAEGLDASAAPGRRRRAPGDVTGRGIRDRPLAGLDELLDATRAASCASWQRRAAARSCAPNWWSAIASARSSEDTPMVPLQQDVTRLQRRLRLKPEAQVKEVTLDLRRENDRERSRLLHRLNLLEVPWGASSRRGPGHRSRRRSGWSGTRARARADPRRPLGHHRRRRGGGAASRPARRRGGERRRARHARRRRAARRPARTRSRRCWRRSPTAPRSIRDTADLMAAVPPLAGILALRATCAASDTSAVVAGCCEASCCGSRSASPGAGRRRRRGDRAARLAQRASTASTPRWRCSRDDEPTRAHGARRCGASPTASGSPGTLAGRATRLLHDAGELEPAPSAMSRAPQPGRGPRGGASGSRASIGTSAASCSSTTPSSSHGPRRLDRDRPAGRLHQRPPAAAAAPSPPFPASEAPPPRRTFAANDKEDSPFIFRSKSTLRAGATRRGRPIARLLAWLTSGCADGGSCSAATRPRGRVRALGPERPGGGLRARRGLRRARGRAGQVGAGGRALAGGAARALPERASCGWCSRTRSTGSASTGCCSSPRCSRTSRPTCTWRRR